jgi:hypothetical protein
LTITASIITPPVSLPPYAPELNPVEDLKDERQEKSCGNVFFESTDALEEHLDASLKGMARDKHSCAFHHRWPWIINAF